MSSTADILTSRFYEWELRGRGWHVCGFPVELEPEFHPFFGHYAPQQAAQADDGIRHTLVSAIRSLFKEKERPGPATPSYLEIPPVGAYPSMCDDPPTVYSVVLPKGAKIDMGDMERLFLMLSYSEHQVSFEIVGTSEAIRIQYACREVDQAMIHAQVKAYFPAAIIAKHDKGLELLLIDTDTCVIDLGMQDEFMRPLCMAGEVKQDPYIGLFAMLEQLRTGESGVIQILFKGVANPWAESVMRSVTDSRGGSFFEDDPDMVKLARDKVSAPLFAVCIRAIGQSNRGERAEDIAMGIANTLTRLTTSKGNRLVPLREDGYPIGEKIHDVYQRQSQRLGMLLNSRELATIVDTQLKQLDKSIPETEAQVDYLKVEYLNGSTVISEAKTLYDRWQTYDYARKRQIVEEITDCIVVGGDAIEISFAYSPAYFRNDPEWQRNRTGSCWLST